MTSDPVNQAIQPQIQPNQLVTELDLGSGVGGRKERATLDIDVIRALTPSDLPNIQNPPASCEIVPLVRNLRSSHHRLAELVAAGRPPAEIAIITGYSPSYISSLKGDPAFAELVAYYDLQRESIFADAMERLKLLGLDAIEKLQERLNDPEKNWTNKELMDLVDMALVQPTVASKSQPGPGGAMSGNNLSLEVRFVGTQPKDGQILNASFTDVTPNQS